MSEHITKSIIVKADVEKVFESWANFENFPLFMENIKTIRKTGDRTSHWEMQGPLGKKLEWTAETTLHEPPTRLAWSSTDGDIKTSGQVTFTQLGKSETQITVMLYYIPPSGLVGEVGAKLFGNPDGRLEEDLRNFKAYIEGMTERTAPEKFD